MASTYPAPSDDEFNLQLDDLPDPIGNEDNLDSSSLDLDDAMMGLDDMKPEELSSWLDTNLDEDDMNFFETVESLEEMDDLQDTNNNLCHPGALGNLIFEKVEQTPSVTLKPLYTPYDPNTHSHVPPKITERNKIQSDIDPHQYNEALNNLAFSMRRTELSRAELIRQRNSMSHVSAHIPQVSNPSVPTQSTHLTGLAGLLSGKSSSLTAGLEQSRRQLREYMARMNSNTF